MRINVHRGGNRRMTQHFADYFGVNAEAHHQSGKGVAIVVQSRCQPSPRNYFLGDMTDRTGVQGRAIKMGEYQVGVVNRKA